MKILFEEIIDTLCGPLSLVFDEDELLFHIDFPDQDDARQSRLLLKRFKSYDLRSGQSKQIAANIQAYLNGDFAALDKIRCETGGTDFQKQVWATLRTIKAGETLSYLELAKRLGNPKAVRAVARANALNPISLIYPCHRIIGSDGSLTGYAGGLHRKEWLLRHEGAIAEDSL